MSGEGGEKWEERVAKRTTARGGMTSGRYLETGYTHAHPGFACRRRPERRERELEERTEGAMGKRDEGRWGEGEGIYKRNVRWENNPAS